MNFLHDIDSCVFGPLVSLYLSLRLSFFSLFDSSCCYLYCGYCCGVTGLGIEPEEAKIDKFI